MGRENGGAGAYLVGGIQAARAGLQLYAQNGPGKEGRSLCHGPEKLYGIPPHAQRRRRFLGYFSPPLCQRRELERPDPSLCVQPATGHRAECLCRGRRPQSIRTVEGELRYFALRRAAFASRGDLPTGTSLRTRSCSMSRPVTRRSSAGCTRSSGIVSRTVMWPGPTC